MNRDTYESYTNMIAELAHLTEQKKILWSKQAKNSFYHKISTDEQNATISIQKIVNRSEKSKGLLYEKSPFEHARGLLELDQINKDSENTYYVFQIMDNYSGKVVVNLSTNDLNKKDYRWLHDNIPKLYLDAKTNYEQTGADYFTNLVKNLKKK